MVRSARIDYRSGSWKMHKAVSFAFWYGLTGWVACRQVEGMAHHTWPVHSGLVVLACLVCLLHPPVQGGHWISYRRFPWWLAPLNAPLYVVNVIPQSAAVNWTEMRLRHAFGFRSCLPGSLMAMGKVGLAPLWAVLAVANIPALARAARL